MTVTVVFMISIVDISIKRLASTNMTIYVLVMNIFMCRGITSMVISITSFILANLIAVWKIYMLLAMIVIKCMSKVAISLTINLRNEKTEFKVQSN